MTDKVQLIKGEIERMYKKAKSVDCFSSSVIETTLERLSDFIDSLPEEHNEDLEEEILKEWKKHCHLDPLFNDMVIVMLLEGYQDTAKHFAEWQKQKDLEDLFKSDMTMPNKFYEKGKADAMKEMKETLQTEYEKGRYDMREELMKNTVLETEVLMDCGGDGIETPYEEWLTLEDTEIPYVPEGFKNGDIVKVVLIKEDLP